MSQNTSNQINDVVNNANTHLQNAIEKGNARRVIISKENGDSIVNVTLTTAIVVGAIGLIFLTELTMLIAIVAVAAGVYTKAKIEVVSVVEADDTPNVVTTSADDSDVHPIA